MFLGPLYILFDEVSVQALCLFFNWIVCLTGLESCEFFIYFGDQTLVRDIIGKYIFPYCSFPFHFADVFFSHAEVLFYFNEVHLFILSFMSLAVGDISVKILLHGLRFPCLCSLLGLIWCHDLYLSLLSMLTLFLCMV